MYYWPRVFSAPSLDGLWCGVVYSGFVCTLRTFLVRIYTCFWSCPKLTIEKIYTYMDVLLPLLLHDSYCCRQARLGLLLLPHSPRLPRSWPKAAGCRGPGRAHRYALAPCPPLPYHLTYPRKLKLYRKFWHEAHTTIFLPCQPPSAPSAPTILLLKKPSIIRTSIRLIFTFHIWKYLNNFLISIIYI